MAQETVDEVFECQRFKPLVGWGNSFEDHLLDSDPGAYTTRDHEPVSEELEYPAPHGWEWAGPPSLDTQYTATDAEGWVYAVDFSYFSDDQPGDANAAPFYEVRRRRWVRTRREVSSSPFTLASTSAESSASSTPTKDKVVKDKQRKKKQIRVKVTLHNSEFFYRATSDENLSSIKNAVEEQVREVHGGNVLDFSINSWMYAGRAVPLTACISDITSLVQRQLLSERKGIELEVLGWRVVVQLPPGPLGILFLDKGSSLEVARVIDAPAQGTQSAKDGFSASQTIQRLVWKGMMLASVDDVPVDEKHTPQEVLEYLSTNQRQPRRLEFIDQASYGQAHGSSGSTTQSARRPFLLHLGVLSARKLTVADLITSDPYVVIQVEGEFVAKTSVKNRTTSPEFNEEFDIPLDFLNATLRCEIMDRDQLKTDDVIGYVDINLADLLVGEDRTETYQVQGGKGTLILRTLITTTPLLDLHVEQSGLDTLRKTGTLTNSQLVRSYLFRNLHDEVSEGTFNWLVDSYLHKTLDVAHISRVAQDVMSLNYDLDSSSLKVDHESLLWVPFEDQCQSRTFTKPVDQQIRTTGAALTRQMSKIRQQQSLTLKAGTLRTDVLTETWTVDDLRDSISVSMQADMLLATCDDIESELELKGLDAGKFWFVITTEIEDYVFNVEEEASYWDWYEAIVHGFLCDRRAWSGACLSEIDEMRGPLRLRRKRQISKGLSEFDQLMGVLEISEGRLRIMPNDRETKLRILRQNVRKVHFSHNFGAPDRKMLRVKAIAASLPNSGAGDWERDGTVCEFSFGNEIVRTPPVTGEFPRWNKTFSFVLGDDTTECVANPELAVKVYPSSHPDRPVGERVVFQQLPEMVPSQGSGALALVSVHTGIEVTLASVSLPDGHPAVKKGVYCSVNIANSTGMISAQAKRKTATVKGSRIDFNDTFRFEYTQHLDTSTVVSIKVKSPGRFHVVQLGEILIPLNTLTSTPSTQDHTVCTFNNQEVVANVTCRLQADGDEVGGHNPVLLYDWQYDQLDAFNTAWPARAFMGSVSETAAELCHVAMGVETLHLLAPYVEGAQLSADKDSLGQVQLLLSKFVKRIPNPDSSASQSVACILVMEVLEHERADASAQFGHSASHLSAHDPCHLTDTSGQQQLPFESLDDVITPDGFEWAHPSHSWQAVHSSSTDDEGWEYANAFWLLDEASQLSRKNSAPTRTRSVRRRLWRRQLVMVKDPSSSCLQLYKSQSRHGTAGSDSTPSTPRAGDLYSRLNHSPHQSHSRGRVASTVGVSPMLERQATANSDRSPGQEAQGHRARVLPAPATGRNFLQCLGFYQGGLRVPYDRVLRVTVLSPTTLKVTLSVDLVDRATRHRDRNIPSQGFRTVPMSIVIGPCPAVQVANTIQERSYLTPFKAHVRDAIFNSNILVATGSSRFIRHAASSENDVLGVVRAIIHTRSAIEQFKECFPDLGTDVLYFRMQIYRGYLEELRAIESSIGSFMQDLSAAKTTVDAKIRECLTRSIQQQPTRSRPRRQSEVDNESTRHIREIVTRTRLLSLGLSDLLRRALMGRADTGLACEILSYGVNAFFARIVETTAEFVSSSKGFSRLQGQQQKLQLMYHLLREDDIVDRILRRYLPLFNISWAPTALLSNVVDIQSVVGRYTNVLETEMRNWCKQILDHHLSKHTESKTDDLPPSWLWQVGPNRTQLFESGLPEDVISALVQYVGVVTKHSWNLDEIDDSVHGEDVSNHAMMSQLHRTQGSASQRQGFGSSANSSLSRQRVLQFGEIVLYSICSALVWLKETLLTMLCERSWVPRPGESSTDNIVFLCALANDCWRLSTAHITQFERDYETASSKAAAEVVLVKEVYGELAIAAVEMIAEVINCDLQPLYDDVYSRFVACKSVIPEVAATIQDYMRDITAWLEPFYCVKLLSYLADHAVLVCLATLREISDANRTLSVAELQQLKSDIEALVGAFAGSSMLSHSPALARLGVLRDMYQLLTAPFPMVTAKDNQYTATMYGGSETPRAQAVQDAGLIDFEGNLISVFVQLLGRNVSTPSEIRNALECCLFLRGEFGDGAHPVWELAEAEFERKPSQTGTASTGSARSAFAIVFESSRAERLRTGSSWGQSVRALNALNPAQSLRHRMGKMRKSLVSGLASPTSAAAPETLTSLTVTSKKAVAKAAAAKTSATALAQNRLSYAQAKAGSSSAELEEEDATFELFVSVLRARDLPNVELVGKTYPFAVAFIASGQDPTAGNVRAVIGQNRFTTNVIAHSLNPIWEQDFAFHLRNAMGLQLVVQVFGFNRFRQHTLLGHVNVSLAGMTATAVETWHDIIAEDGKVAGHLQIRVSLCAVQNA